MGYGKWIGGGLGWAFGGPIGAILGYAFGSMFDKAQKSKDNDDFYNKQNSFAGHDFAASLLVLSAAVMKADGKLLKSELEYIKSFVYQQFGAEKASYFMLDLREILKQDIPIRAVSIQIREHLNHSSRLHLFHYLWGIAAADGQIHHNEELLLKKIASYFYINPKDYNSIKAMFTNGIESSYKILEVNENASVEEIKKAYRKMAIKYHPDKVSHLGNEYTKAAEEKFSKLNEAYEKIKKQRGFN